MRSLRTPDAQARSRTSRGFTLVELLVAIGVMSIATWVFVSFYTTAQELNRTSVARTAATHFAEAALQSIIRDPSSFHWAIPENSAGTLFPIGITSEDPLVGNTVAVPAAMPLDRVAFQREINFHNNFRWAAFGRLPEAEAPHYEVTVLVRWMQGGREQSIALTSSVARFRVGGEA